MSLYTIDPYTSVEQYNDALQALRNNSVSFTQMVFVRPPYTWYLKLPYAPLLINYDTIDDTKSRFCVNKVQAINPADDFSLLRRESNGQDGIIKYIENEALKEARLSDNAVFFHVDSAEAMKQASKMLPGVKIYYFGKHMDSRYRVGLCSNSLIKNFISPNNIMLEKNKTSSSSQGNDYSKPGFFEADLNYKVFKKRDTLKKFSQTPYFLNGTYYNIKFRGELDNADNMIKFSF